jgi:hypothetical protein
MTIAARPELAQSIPASGQGPGLTTYTWYDHPFVLRVVFGRNVASLGSINSSATVARPLADDADWRGEAGALLCAAFAVDALAACNSIIAVVRRQGRLHHVFDLRREDIDVSVRSYEGAVLREDPLQGEFLRKEQAASDVFDLADRDAAWYEQLNAALLLEEPVSLADDLLIEAERALRQRFPRQAIATCHSTIEAAASSLLTRGMQKQGLGNEEIDEALSTRSLTAKLEVLLRRYTGFSLKRDNYALWRSFNALNDLRNDIVHRGLRPTHDQGAFAIGVTRELLAWLNMVRDRNR